MYWLLQTIVVSMSQLDENFGLANRLVRTFVIDWLMWRKPILELVYCRHVHSSGRNIPLRAQLHGGGEAAGRDRHDLLGQLRQDRQPRLQVDRAADWSEPVMWRSCKDLGLVGRCSVVPPLILNWLSPCPVSCSFSCCHRLKGYTYRPLLTECQEIVTEYKSNWFSK